jgi:hypothetical protein
MLRRGETMSGTKPGFVCATRSKEASALSGSPRSSARRPERNSLSEPMPAQAAIDRNAIKRSGFMVALKIGAGLKKDKIFSRPEFVHLLSQGCSHADNSRRASWFRSK